MVVRRKSDEVAGARRGGGWAKAEKNRRRVTRVTPADHKPALRTVDSENGVKGADGYTVTRARWE